MTDHHEPFCRCAGCRDQLDTRHAEAITQLRAERDEALAALSADASNLVLEAAHLRTQLRALLAKDRIIGSVSCEETQTINTHALEQED